MPTVVWPGTDQEGAELLHVLQENCTRARAEDGSVVSMCAGHAALRTQRFVDGLVFARRMADCFRRAEHASVDPPEGNG